MVVEGPGWNLKGPGAAGTRGFVWSPVGSGMTSEGNWGTCCCLVIGLGSFCHLH